VAEASAGIPRPEGDDPDEVAVALETAKALWGIGDKQEAVRWLRRGAEAAEQAGNDLRAVRLARAAADLMGELETESSASDLPAAPNAEARPQPPPTPITPHSPAASGLSSRPPPGPKLGSRPPPPPSAARAARVLATRSHPPPPAPSAKTRSIPPTVAAVSTDDKPTPPEAPAKSPSDGAMAKALRSPAPAKKRALPELERKSANVTDAEQGPDVWHAVRVSVKASARDPNLFIVRRLSDSKTAPPGTREALIMLMDSNADFLGDKD
jgi:hypothetical protein